MAAVLPATSMAQVYNCAVLHHWRNAVFEGDYVGDPEPAEGATMVLDFNQAKIRSGSGQVMDGKVVAVAGASSIGMLGGGAKELSIFAVFPRIADPKGGVLGSVMRLEDNEYMPKGTLMSRLSCRQQ